MNWPAQGVHEGIPFELYRSDDIKQSDDRHTVKGKSVSKSMITDFIPDPSAWKAKPAKIQTAAMKGGSLFDCLLTCPEEFDSRYAISEYTEFRTNESKAWRDIIEAGGMEVLKPAQLELAQAQVAAVIAKPEAANLIFGSRKQVAFRHATKYGFGSKGLIDIVPNDDSLLVDIKTCQPSAMESKRDLQRHIFEWGYHIQAGAYCEGWTIASGQERSRFKFIFVTSSAPFRVAVIELPLAAILFGADQYRAGMKRFSECIEADRWPSIWDGEVELDLPEYAYVEGNA